MKQLIKYILSITLFIIPSFSFAGDLNWGDTLIEDAKDVKQEAFCRLVETYKTRANEAKNSMNQIKMMAVSQEQADDLKALIKDKKYENWIAQVKRVDLVKAGGAAENKYNVKLSADLGCGVTIHSSVEVDDKKIGEVSSPILFKQLEKVSSGDFVLISGEFKNDFVATEFCIENKCSNKSTVNTSFASTYDTLVMFK